MILDAFRLDGKVALVTGASRGLGQGLALGLAEAGADIVGISRGQAEETAKLVKQLGRRYAHLSCELGQATVADLENLVERTVATMGRIDILVNAAGINLRHPSLEFPESDWDLVMQVNCKSVMFLSQAAARRFARQGGGKIINVASALSFQGGYIVPAYTAAKHALLGITRALANEFAALHINVNAIAPGYFNTDMTAALMADPNREPTITQRIPAGRWGTSQDLKGAVVFLASEASSYCHGSVLVVDGGWLNR
ncbi:MAG: 2-dehydro-3-deoxy-D-gluconate 5-dehydrogenase KduD [Anaerolineae bacterium]